MNIDKKRRFNYIKNLKKREELKIIIKKNKYSNPEELTLAQIKLKKMSKNSSKERIKNRCILTGRSKGIIKKFKISRIVLRELLATGYIPGIRKSSW